MDDPYGLRDRRTLRVLVAFTCLAAAAVTAFAVRFPASPSALDLLILCAAFTCSAATVHYKVDGGVFTWALTETAVGLCAGAGDGRWGAFALVAGLFGGYCLVKMRTHPVRGVINSAAYAVGAVGGLACASLVPIGRPASAPVRGAVASGVTSLTVLALVSTVIAYVLRRRWPDAVRIGLRADCVHAAAGAVTGATMSWLVSTDTQSAVVAVVAAMILFPVVAALRAARAECGQLRGTLEAATDLLRAPDSASAEAVLLSAAGRVTGTSTVRLLDGTSVASERAITVPVPTTTAPQLCLMTDARQGLPLHPPLRAMLTTLAHCAGVALDAARQRQQWRHLAEHDPLTGLLNRRAFVHALTGAVEHAADHGGRLAVVFVDLNGFKAVNDTHGHDAGDRVLVAVAAQLRHVTREQDLAARLGGDEFCLAMVGHSAPAMLEGMADRVHAAVASASHDIRAAIACSVGIAWYPEDGALPDQLLGVADARMYDAKRQRVSGVA